MMLGGKEVLVASLDKDRRPALHYAAGIGSEAAVELLLENGAEPDLGDNPGVACPPSCSAARSARATNPLWCSSLQQTRFKFVVELQAAAAACSCRVARPPPAGRGAASRGARSPFLEIFFRDRHF